MANPVTIQIATEEPKPQESPTRKVDYDLSTLGGKLAMRFEEFRQARQTQEEMWLRDMRQFLGVYDPEILGKIKAAGKKSEVYVGITRTKVMAAYSKIIDLLFQTGEQPYSIEPTPVPNIPGLRERMMKKAAMDLMMAAQTADPAMIEDLIEDRKDEIEDDIKREARERSQLMLAQIQDQTAEANLEQKLKGAILEMCVLGSCGFKSGTVTIERKSHWIMGENGHQLAIEEAPVPEIDLVSVFDLYPDPYATSVEDCDGLFRRHILTKHQFRGLRDRPGYKEEVIEKVIEQNPNGNHVEEQHETERRAMTARDPSFTSSNRFEVLEFWGMVDGKFLNECGVEEITEELFTVELEANVWFCAGEVIKVQMNPLPRKRIPYMIAPYEKMPHQLWGISVPRMMRDSQVTLNAAVRVMIDNAAISSGPMVEVNSDLLAAGEDPTNIYAWRVFIREGGDPAAPMVRFYQPESNTTAVQNLIELFHRFADETTSLPSYTHGMQTSSLNATASGMSMLMGAANINLKSVIKNLDDYLIKPMIEALYDWNMEFSDREDIKGDMRIIARGSTALIQKEVQSQRIMQFMSVAAQSPAAAAVDWVQLLRDGAKAMDLDAGKLVPKNDAPPQGPPGMPAGVMPGQPGPDAMPMPAPPPPDTTMGMGANGGMSNA